MAKSLNLKPFYWGLGVIGVAGLAWIVSARGGGSVTLPANVSVATGSFPGYVLGSDSALVEIVEYADFQCPACATFAILSAPDVKSRLVNTGRVRLRFRDFPLDIHDKAPLAHLVAACAAEQGQFWPMHDQLFYNQGTWARERRPRRLFDGYARAIGLDMAQYGACVDSEELLPRIAATRQEGIQLGVSSTPSFVIGDQLVAGSIPIAQIIRLVERAEAAAARR